MTDLEDRLRRDLTMLAERVQPADTTGPRPLPARRAPRAARWLAPAGAVVAIAVVALIVVFVTTGPGTTTTSPIAAKTAPAPGLPRFYVALVQNPSGAKYATEAIVHASATGATLATVSMPTLYASDGSSSGPGISAAADDRTYLITETNGSGPDHWLARFYLLRVAADGHSATVRKLPVSWPRTLAPDQQAALSPDGTRIAIDVQGCYAGGCHYSGIRVITIATGAVRSWTTQVQGAPFQLSWAGNSRVAFEWQSNSKTPPPALRTGYRLLDVGGPAGDLLSGQVIATPPTTATGSMPTALVTPDGSRVITTTTTAHRDGLRTDTVVGRVVELDARTGKLLRVLATSTATHVSTNENSPTSAASLEQGCYVVSLAPHGLNVLASCFSFGRVGTSGFTPLAGSPPAWDGAAFAW
jgi:hypothetical protein